DTRTGAVMGTPSYLAPEQAQGSKDVGPPTDVWALGAILYECLTGRPPFQGATVADVLLQVISQDPKPPTHFCPEVTQDLEAICLKCLEKAPQQRYAQADDLANDLGRLLAGEPVQARPIDDHERLVRWAKRRGYEVLEAVARGEMGVVYKARQIKL